MQDKTQILFANIGPYVQQIDPELRKKKPMGHEKPKRIDLHRSIKTRTAMK